MKIAMYHPTERDKLFTKHTGHEFVFNTCDSTCDMIYAASVSRVAQAITAQKKFKIPVVCWCWDIPYNWREWGMSPQGVSDNSYRDQQNTDRVKLLKQCNLVITASKWVQEGIKDKYGIDSIQIYQYIDTEGLDAIPNQIKLNTITQVSRFFYNKKFHNTVIAAKDINIGIEFIGTGIASNYGKEIKAAIDKYNPRVIINDTLSRELTIQKIKQSKLLVSPSVFEGWGITPVEALYCETPILLSDLPVFKEVYGDNIIYHKRNDTNDMAKQLNLILNDESIQKEIVTNCQPIIKEFTPVKFGKRFNNIIKTIL